MTREEQIEEMLPYMCHCCEMEAGFGKCAEMRDAEKCVLAREAAEALFAPDIGRKSQMSCKQLRMIVENKKPFRVSRRRAQTLPGVWRKE